MKGLNVLASKLGFTESHQIAVDVTKYGDGGNLEKDLEKANIIVNRQLIPGDIQAGRHYMHPGGLRLGTSEVTRLGMKKDEMKQIASLMARIIVKKEDPLKVKREVEGIRRFVPKSSLRFRDWYTCIQIHQNSLSDFGKCNCSSLLEQILKFENLFYCLGSNKILVPYCKR